MKLKLRDVAFALLLCLAILGAIVASNAPANASLGVATCGVSGCVSTPPLSSSTSYSYSGTSVVSFTTTSSSYTTSISSSTTTTTMTTTSTSHSYTSTISTTITSTTFTTSYTGTSTSTNTNWVTEPTTTTSTTTWASLVTVKGTSSSCPITYVTRGSRLELYANFLRNFRNNAIENTTAGREFLITFNSWYYSWAPSLAYSATTNPILFKAVQVGVVPLLGILYASYYSYNFMAPLSPEVGALTAGIVAASLIGAAYVAPGAYVATRLIGQRRRLWISKQITRSSVVMFGASVLVCVAAYVMGSGQLLAIATSGIVLTMLSLGTFGGARVLTYMQMPVTNFATMALTLKRFAKTQF